MSKPPSLSEGVKSASVFPQTYDVATDTVRLVRVSPDVFADASFLDDRLFQGRKLASQNLPFKALAAATEAAGLGISCGYILHLGHVGSTLVSRLLGAHPSVLAIREPPALRILAELSLTVGGPECLLSPKAFERRLEVLLKLWSRTFAADQLSIVKATSIGSELAGRLVGVHGGRAITLISTPEVYLTNFLAGHDAVSDARLYASNRIRRLHRRLGEPRWRLDEMQVGELIAMGWATEMSALTAAAETAPDGRMRWQDFDRFLAAPDEGLAGAFAHFGRPVEAAEISAIVSGPLMSQYSKGPSLKFDTATRGDKFKAAQARHGPMIASGLAWLERAAGLYPQIAGAVALAERVAAGQA